MGKNVICIHGNEMVLSVSTSANSVQLKAKQSQQGLCLMKHNRQYLNALFHFRPCHKTWYATRRVA